jgi:hypothetical protein
VSRRRFENWAQAIDVEGVLTCAPRTPSEVVAVVNWAWQHGYRVRALGRAHTLSPLALARTPARSPRVLLVDTTRHLTRMHLAGAGPAAVVTQTGATMEMVLGFLEAAGLGLTAYPAPGDLTVGGVLAIDGHGTAIPSPGEQRARGQSFGSVSNLVLSLTAVVWSERHHRYVLRTFERDDPVCANLLTNLGRTLVTAVALRAGPLRHLRCPLLRSLLRAQPVRQGAASRVWDARSASDKSPTADARGVPDTAVRISKSPPQRVSIRCYGPSLIAMVRLRRVLLARVGSRGSALAGCSRQRVGAHQWRRAARDRPLVGWAWWVFVLPGAAALLLAALAGPAAAAAGGRGPAAPPRVVEALVRARSVAAGGSLVAVAALRGREGRSVRPRVAVDLVSAVAGGRVRLSGAVVRAGGWRDAFGVCARRSGDGLGWAARRSRAICRRRAIGRGRSVPGDRQRRL